jgi:hypothetical protein
MYLRTMPMATSAISSLPLGNAAPQAFRQAETLNIRKDRLITPSAAGDLARDAL